MKAEKRVFDYSSERQKVKQLSKALPDIRVTVFPATLVIKTIDLSDLP